MGETTEGGLFLVGIVTLVLAVLVGFLLSRFAQHSSVVADTKDLSSGAVRGASSAPLNANLPQPIRQELEQLPLPAEHRQRFASRLSGLMEQELEVTRQDLARKFDQTVQAQKREIQVVKQQYQHVSAQQKQTESVLRSIAEGLVVVNPKGEVMYINPAAEKLLGVSQDEKKGRPLNENLTDEQMLALVKQPGAQQDDVELELSSNQDQTKRIVRSSNAVIQDQNGQTVGMVSVLSDITKQRELDRMKSDFLASVTHELRTPLVAMQHSLQVMLDGSSGELTADQRNFLGIAQRNLQRLTTMINNLLDLSKLERGKVELQKQRSSVAPIIQSTCQALDAWVKTKSLQLSRRIANPLPDVLIDVDQITQVLYNLASNAIKFTPAGGSVTISARLATDGKAVEVAVADTGVGISQEDMPKLFQKFQQVGDPKNSSAPGTGLGLALVKGIIELHGGKIWCDSAGKGQGTRFIFTLPLASSG